MTGKTDGKVAFITGAARGQGRSHALRFAEEGADIIALDVCAPIDDVPYPGATEEDLQETVRQVEARGRKIISTVCDVRDLAKMKTFVAGAVKELGRLDIVVANAGIAILTPWNMTTPEIVRTTVDINLIGVWNTAMAAVPHMIEAGNGGSLILIGSANGIKPGPWAIAYNMSKSGVTAIAKTFAAELARDGIRANSIHPGGVNTTMTQHHINGESSFEVGGADNPMLLGMYTSWIPGPMEASDITNAVLFLASDEANWITGQALAVDGGVTQY